MEHAALERIRDLVRRIETCEIIFLSPSDLQEAFGIEARQVGSAENGFPLFEPRFFEPHPERVLQKYPIDVVANHYDVRQLDCVPTLSDALDTVRKTSPAPENILEAAQRLLDERLEEFWSWDFHNHADSIHCHIEYELGVIREGGPSPIFTLEHLMGLQGVVYVTKRRSSR